MNNVTPVTPTTPLPPVIVTPVPTPIPTPSLPLSAPAYITTALYSYSTKTASGTIIRNNYIYSYWAKVPDATGYVLERTNAKGGTVGYKSISLPSSLTSYFDMTVSSGMSYIYKIKAIKSTQSSAFTSSKVMIIP